MPAGIVGSLEYAVDLFERPSVEALIERLGRLMEAAVADPDRAIGLIDILSTAERTALLRDGEGIHVALPPATLPELFAVRAAGTPDATAVVHGDESLSYGALDRRANQLAHHLRALGVGPETVVGLCVERSPELIVGVLGILKAGGAYLPLDPSYPDDRLRFMLSDARAPVLVTQAGLRGRLDTCGVDCMVCLDSDGPAIVRQPTVAPAIAVDPQSSAYVIYTSGSTGTPKGVVVTHRGIPNLAAAQIDRLDIGAEARVLQFASLGFDACDLRDQQPFSRRGATLVLPGSERSGEGLAQLIRGAAGDACDAAACGGSEPAGGPAAGDAGGRGRGLPGRVGGPLVGGPADDQRLWPDRDDGGRDHERSAGGRRRSADRSPDLEHAGVRAGRGPGAGAGGGCG